MEQVAKDGITSGKPTDFGGWYNLGNQLTYVHWENDSVVKHRKYCPSKQELTS